MFRRVENIPRRRVTVTALGAVIVLGVASLIVGAGREEPKLPLSGLPGSLIGAEALAKLALHIDAHGHDPHHVRLTLDGKPVNGQLEGDIVTYRPGRLSDGTHTVAAVVPPGGLWGFLHSGPTASATFTVDTTPPKLTLEPSLPVASYREPITVRGHAFGAERVDLAGRQTVPRPDGTFEITLPQAPTGSDVVALDAAGNTTHQAMATGVHLPRISAVHVTANAWSYDPLREGVLALAREHRINTVELDIKDEDGIVGYDSRVPLARQSGASAAIYNAPAALRQLHDLGVRVVGRIVAFRDPMVAGWAWHNGHRDWVAQNASGQPYSSGYGAIAFTNFAAPAIRDYNIALASEGARIGFDGIMFDYVRRPDGDISGMRFPGLAQDPAVSIADFLRQSRDPVHAAGSFLAAAVFGIAATRPGQIAQDVPAIARTVDVVAPMVYPSHWNYGEYGVANPNSQPYDIVLRSLQDFRAHTAGTNVQIMPWLQDFSLGVSYGEAQVRAQIDATRAAGLDSFFLWSPGVEYHGGAIDPH